VLDECGEPRYALSVAGPASRLGRQRLTEVGEIVAEAAKAVSKELGFSE
jgi:DNA-binding IclR family transcriptional regulator